MTNNKQPSKGYLIIKTIPQEESLKDIIEQEEDERIFSIEEQGEKIIVGIEHEEIEEIAEIASTIVYNCISLEIYTIVIKYCGK